MPNPLIHAQAFTPNPLMHAQAFTAAELSVNKEVLQVCAKVVMPGRGGGSRRRSRHEAPPQVWVAARCNYVVHVMRVRAEPRLDGKYKW